MAALYRKAERSTRPRVRPRRADDPALPRTLAVFERGCYITVDGRRVSVTWRGKISNVACTSGWTW